MKNIYTNKSDIIAWLDDYNIKNYELIADEKYGYVVDISGDAELSKKGLSFVPIKFNNVNGNFSCDSNNLTSLQFCPHTVNGNFLCYINNLTSLEFCPKIVNGSFYCHSNNLTSLEFCPHTINGSFDCGYNKLANLIYFPNHIGDVIYLENNKLTEENININKYYSFEELYSIHLKHKITAEQELLNNILEANPKEISCCKANKLKI